MSEKLLPCPFCGPGNSCVDLWHDDVAKRWRVGCGACGCSTGTSPRDKTKAPAIAAWNRRTPAPEGEVVAWQVRQIGTDVWVPLDRYTSTAPFETRPLYASPVVPAPEGEACPTCNGVGPEFCSSAFHLASPVVPKTADEIKAVVMAWLDADDPASWGNFEKRLNAAVSDEASPVVPAGREEIARIIRDTIDCDYDGTVFGHKEAADAILAALRPTDTGRE